MKDVAEYGRMCGKSDPESPLIFQAALTPPSAPRSEPSSAATTQTATGGPPQSMVAGARDDSFGLSPSGEKRGWVALQRREPGKDSESHFDESAVTDKALPNAGAKLTARRLIPVWMEPLPPGPNPPEKLQGRLVAGGCVRVLATKPGVPDRSRGCGPVLLRLLFLRIGTPTPMNASKPVLDSLIADTVAARTRHGL